MEWLKIISGVTSSDPACRRMLFLAVKAGIHTHTETVGSVGHPLRTEGIFKLGSIDPNGMLIGVYSYFVVFVGVLAPWCLCIRRVAHSQAQYIVRWFRYW
jgi:hypothetical protein